MSNLVFKSEGLWPAGNQVYMIQRVPTLLTGGSIRLSRRSFALNVDTSVKRVRNDIGVMSFPHIT